MNAHSRGQSAAKHLKHLTLLRQTCSQWFATRAGWKTLIFTRLWMHWPTCGISHSLCLKYCNNIRTTASGLTMYSRHKVSFRNWESQAGFHLNHPTCQRASEAYRPLPTGSTPHILFSWFYAWEIPKVITATLSLAIQRRRRLLLNSWKWQKRL